MGNANEYGLPTVGTGTTIPRPRPQTPADIKRLIDLANTLANPPAPEDPTFVNHVAELARFYHVPFEQMQNTLTENHKNQMVAQASAAHQDMPATRSIIEGLYSAAVPRVDPQFGGTIPDADAQRQWELLRNHVPTRVPDERAQTRQGPGGGQIAPGGTQYNQLQPIGWRTRGLGDEVVHDTTAIVKKGGEEEKKTPAHPIAPEGLPDWWYDYYNIHRPSSDPGKQQPYYSPGDPIKMPNDYEGMVFPDSGADTTEDKIGVYKPSGPATPGSTRGKILPRFLPGGENL